MTAHKHPPELIIFSINSSKLPVVKLQQAQENKGLGTAKRVSVSVHGDSMVYDVDCALCA